jgi:myo-inositol-1(or 4)-monophosphatase
MTIMVAAAQKAARRLVRDFNEVEHLQVSVKGPSDFVSQADMRAEQTIREELERARPGYAFLMEESGAHGSENWAWRWIVDPLDGTTNFLHAIPNWAISIALEKRLADGGSEIVAGMVMAPALDELFWAEKGAGAYLNDRRLRVSSRRDWSSALFATGIPFAKTAPRNRLAFARVLGALMPETAGVRRVGAASLDLAWTAAGRYDGYWELGTHLWDIAAGALMVREAGGYATAPDGGDALSGDIVAGNPHIHPRLRELVGSALETAKT